MAVERNPRVRGERIRGEIKGRGSTSTWRAHGGEGAAFPTGVDIHRTEGRRRPGAGQVGVEIGPAHFSYLFSVVFFFVRKEREEEKEKG